MPAFRWYEKETGTLLVANHPRDAAVIQARLSDGRGLLADGGVSISNIFSGDAPTSLLTMSGLVDRTTRRGPSRSFATFFINPYGLTRSVVLTAAEMIKEVHQARLQRVRGVEPRISRHGSYILLRGVTNVLLRDLNAGLIADQMMAGAPSVYCDFTDYDEIAHHAGPTRPESLASLAGIDQLIGVLEKVAARAPRPYHFVVLSDHGQSQGATFLQRYGMPLQDLVSQLMGGGTVAASAGLDETVGPVNTFLTQVGQQGGTTGKLTKRAFRGQDTGRRDQPRHVAGSRQPDRGRLGAGADRVREPLDDLLHPPAGADEAAGHRTALPGSGRRPDRASRHRVHRGPHERSRDGRARQEGHPLPGRGPGRGNGPTRGFGPQAVADVRRHDTLAHVGDLVINSPIDPGTEEVAAYEELVGCHGGLGGWQTEAVLVHPADWLVDAPPLIGADAVHHQMVRWLEQLGQRRHLTRGSLRVANAVAGGTTRTLRPERS